MSLEREINEPRGPRGLTVGYAHTRGEVEEAQRLRHQVLVGEMGARSRKTRVASRHSARAHGRLP